MEGVSAAQRAHMEVDAIYVRSGIRKMSLVAVMLAAMLAGSASQGSIGRASDLRGSVTGLFGLAGLMAFAAFEGWLTVTDWTPPPAG